MKSRNKFLLILFVVLLLGFGSYFVFFEQTGFADVVVEAGDYAVEADVVLTFYSTGNVFSASSSGVQLFNFDSGSFNFVYGGYNTGLPRINPPGDVGCDPIKYVLSPPVSAVDGYSDYDIPHGSDCALPKLLLPNVASPYISGDGEIRVRLAAGSSDDVFYSLSGVAVDVVVDIPGGEPPEELPSGGDGVDWLSYSWLLIVLFFLIAAFFVWWLLKPKKRGRKR